MAEEAKPPTLQELRESVRQKLVVAGSAAYVVMGYSRDIGGRNTKDSAKSSIVEGVQKLGHALSGPLGFL